MNKYTIKTIAIYSDVVDVEADSLEDAEIKAHEEASYEYEAWYDTKLLRVEHKDDE